MSAVHLGLELEEEFLVVGKAGGDVGHLRLAPDSSDYHRVWDDVDAWLFLDQSRNGSRRWCEMTVCGNRRMVRRFRQFQRASRAALHQTGTTSGNLEVVR
jgi:hypothetical protein